MNRTWPAKGILPISLLAIWSCTDTATLLTPEARVQASHLVPDCFGRNATIYIGSPGAGTITPDGSGGYTITGTSGDDVIVGGSGNDIINAGDGTDRVCGGDGDDVVSGGDGTNYVDGELGRDVADYSGATAGVSVNLATGKGRSAAIIDASLLNIESVLGSAFDDELRGNAVSNTFRGGDGNDVLYGFEEADTLHGQAGNDELNGGDGADMLTGGTDDDQIIPGPGADWIVGQSGFDVVSYKGSVAVEVNLATNIGANGDAAGDTWRGIEGIIGTNGNDVLTGDSLKNRIDGGAGDDLITGGEDRDLLSGGPGADEIHGGDEADHIFGQDGDDELYGDEGDDVFSSGPGLNIVDGGNGSDRMVSTNCLDTVTSIEIMQSDRCTEDTSNSTVETAATSIVANGSSTTTITVTLKDAGGNTFTFGGATVVLTTDAGTLSNGGTPAASVTATDQNDGTYTAALIASTALETATVTATVNGDALTDDAVVTFTVGELDHFLVEAAGGGAIATQIKNAPFNIQVTAQDANNHTVTDFTATVSLDYEGDVSGSITATSGAFTAGVLSSQSVTIPATAASVQIRATDETVAHTGVSLAFAVDPSDEAPVVTSTTPVDAALGIAATSAIGITFSENVTVTAASFDLECPAASDRAFTLSGSNASYTLTPDAMLPGVTTCTVTVIAANVSDTDTDDAPDNMAADHVFSFTTSPVAMADTYTETVLGNVSVNSANAVTSFSILANDEIDGGTTITSTGWTGTPGVTENGGTVSVTPGGTFTYNPPAGFEGTDRFTYTLTGGSSADVTLTVSGMLWFVNNAGAACVSVAAGCGRLSNPLSTLAAFNTENTGVGNRPATGDGIFLYESVTPYSGAVTLLASQELIGQDATTSLAALGYTVPASSSALPVMNSGNATKVTISGTDGINLGTGNGLHGFTVATTAGEAIGGTGFGALTLAATPDVTIASSGQALGLTNGSIVGMFASIGATGGTNNIHLDNVVATLTLGTGTLSGATGAAIRIAGGSPLNLTVPGAVTQASNAALLDVSGSHTGTLNFTNTSNLQASNGTGLQFNAAGGTYTFSGTTNLAGGDAGVDITNSSSGSFTFGTGTTITNPTGVGFRLYGSTASVTYSGNMSKSSAGDIIEIGEHSSGTATFNTGTISATSGTGVSFSNADGTYNFNGTTTLNGGDAGIDIVSGSGGTFTFASGTSITNPTGTAFRVNASAPASSSYAGTITANNGRAVEFSNGVTPAACGTATFSGNLAGSGASASGILVDRCNSGSITFSSTSKTFTTNTNNAVTISNNGATVNFTNGGLVLATTSGSGFNASGGGTVSVSGTGNTVNSSGGGTAVNISNTTIGGSGVTFARVDATGSGTNGIVLTNTGAGSFLVDGGGEADGANTTKGRTTARQGGGTLTLGAGGTISGRSGDGVNVATAGSVTLRNMVVSGGSADGIDVTSATTLVLDNMQVTGHTNNRGVSVQSTSGLKVRHSDISGNATTAGAGAASLYNLQLNNVTGTDSIANSFLNNAFGFVLHAANSSGTLTMHVINTQITGATNGIAAGVYPAGTSNVTFNFQNDSIGHSSARGFQGGTGIASSAVFNVTINNTAFRNNFVGIDNAHGSSGTYTFNFTNNRLQTNVVSSAQAINVNRLGSASFSNFGIYSGTISGNTIGTAGTANSGSDVGDGINVESNGSGGITRVAILNNTIREVGQRGIYLAAVDTDIAGAVVPTLHARVQSNTITNFEAVALDGIQVIMGSLNTDNPNICLNISGNTVTTAPRNGIRVRTSGLPSSTPALTLQGWDGVTLPATFFATQNPAAAGAVANTNYSLGGGTDDPGACTTP
jgi:hypothetical protein